MFVYVKMETLLHVTFFCCFCCGVVLCQSSNCVTPNGENGQCMKLRSCKVLLNAINRNDPSLDKFIDASACGPANVCCGTAENYTQIPLEPKAPNAQTINKDYALKKLLPTKTYCGMQHWDDYFHDESPTENTSIDEFPWLISLNDGFCNAVLINPRYALTVPECAVKGRRSEKYGGNKAVIGEHSKSKNISCVKTQFDTDDCTEPKVEVHIEQYIDSPDFGVTLIRLDGRISYTDFVRPICLPTEEYELPKINQTVISATWYRKNDDDEGVRRQNELIKTKWNLNVTSMNEECESETRASLNFPENISTDNIICFSPAKRGSSLIFSWGFYELGRPVMHKYQTNWFLGGIIPSIKGSPSGVRMTSEVVNWILENMRD